VIALVTACTAVDPSETTTDCPRYSGFDAQGAAWTWEAGSGAWTETLDRFEGGGPVIVQDDETWWRYRCGADGLFLVESRAGTATTTYEPPALILPVSIEDGDAWSSDQTASTVESGGDVTLRTTTVQYSVAGSQDLETAVGTFSTLYLVLLDENGEQTEEWRDVSAGRVGRSGAVLTGYSP
jgi:hypothetical protein